MGKVVNICDKVNKVTKKVNTIDETDVLSEALMYCVMHFNALKEKSKPSHEEVEKCLSLSAFLTLLDTDKTGKVEEKLMSIYNEELMSVWGDMFENTMTRITDYCINEVNTLADNKGV